MAETFKLPVSSYEELVKLFQAYANVKDGTTVSLDQISQATGISRTIVSKNNGFLVQVGVIDSEGNKKSTTDIGRSLGRAYTSKIYDEVERIWKEIISEVDFLSRMVSAVRIRNGMDRANFVNHIIYSSGLKDSKESRAGAGAVIDIFKSVGILNEADGKLTVIDEVPSLQNSEAVQPEISTQTAETAHVVLKPIEPTASGISINININCTIDDLDSLGEKIKKLVEQISGQDEDKESRV